MCVQLKNRCEELEKKLKETEQQSLQSSVELEKIGQSIMQVRPHPFVYYRLYTVKPLKCTTLNWRYVYTCIHVLVFSSCMHKAARNVCK